MKILVVGGAGYIGSQMVKNLHVSGHHPVTFDNLESGTREAVLYGDFILGDLQDNESLYRLFSQHSFDGVMHFAGSIKVEESVNNPRIYYQNNVVNTLNLINAMLEHDVKHLVFSSTAAIYGIPQYTPVDEQHPKNPINPYGWSKLMVEQILKDYDYAYGLKSACLRYFNAAGADPDGELGQRQEQPANLIPLILQVAAGKKGNITVYGDDYETPDGTCIRDYIHVNDLCDAHMLALGKLKSDNLSLTYNLGNGLGYSVREVIDTAKQVTGKLIPVEFGLRRAGDSACVIADSSLATQELEWKPQFPSLENILNHAWSWCRINNDKH